MQWRKAAAAWGGSPRCLSQLWSVLAVAALAAGAAGCSSSPSNGRMTLASIPASGATVAFESIDGPPPEVFSKLVTSLNDEAGTRKIPVVSRSAAATYRVRGYVSAQVDRNKTSFSWVWDVYDADKRRTLRITGEEPAGAARRRDAWAAADEQVVRRMARNGMDQIAAFLNSPEPAPAVVPENALVTLASARDDSPEAAGIFRLFGGQDQVAGSTAENTADLPMPPEPPKAKAQSKAKKNGEKRPDATAKHASASGPSTDGRSPSR